MTLLGMDLVVDEQAGDNWYFVDQERLIHQYTSEALPIMVLARMHRDQRLLQFEPEFFRSLVKEGKADY